jgi:hypothetical protein
MKRTRALLVIILLISGCSGENKLETIKKKVTTPIWTNAELPKGNENMVTYQVTSYESPPFFRGSKPISYEIGKSVAWMNQSFGRDRVEFFKFAAFKTYFYFEGTKMVGAITVNSQGKLIAEARLKYSYVKVDDEGTEDKKVEMEEFHYNTKGELSFYCKSNIDSRTGYKISEKEVAGQKQEEYYFLWPYRCF